MSDSTASKDVPPAVIEGEVPVEAARRLAESHVDRSREPWELAVAAVKEARPTMTEPAHDSGPFSE